MRAIQQPAMSSHRDFSLNLIASSDTYVLAKSLSSGHHGYLASSLPDPFQMRPGNKLLLDYAFDHECCEPHLLVVQSLEACAEPCRCPTPAQ